MPRGSDDVGSLVREKASGDAWRRGVAAVCEVDVEDGGESYRARQQMTTVLGLAKDDRLHELRATCCVEGAAEARTRNFRLACGSREN